MRTDCNKQVRRFRTGLLQNRYGCRIPMDRHDIGGTDQPGKSGLIFINDCDIIGFMTQHLGQMRADFSRSYNYDSHIRLIAYPANLNN